jgi:hypothetical protein
VNLPVQSLPDIETDVPPPPKRLFNSSFAFIGVVVIGALVVVMCVLGTTMSGLFNFTSAGDTTNDAAAAPSSTAPHAVQSDFDDGQWLVAVDILAGTYAVTVPATSAGCTWERNASSSGTPSSVLESGMAKPGEALVIGIKDTDKVFQSNGCGVWHRTGDIQPSQDTSYTDNNGGGTND